MVVLKARATTRCANTPTRGRADRPAIGSPNTLSEYAAGQPPTSQECLRPVHGDSSVRAPTDHSPSPLANTPARRVLAVRQLHALSYREITPFRTRAACGSIK